MFDKDRATIAEEEIGSAASAMAAGERDRKARSTPDRFLIAGLGNPGREYRHNRHNIGFMLIDRLAEKWGIPLSRQQQKALVGVGQTGPHRIVLAKPQTFMNRSGDAIGPLARFYRIETSEVLVAYDELDIPFGHLRLRMKGGAGGHNGMRSVIQHLGPDFPRLRLGIGRPPGRVPPAAFVLQEFDDAELNQVDALLDAAASAVETFLTEGIEIAMSRHNGPGP